MFMYGLLTTNGKPYGPDNPHPMDILREVNRANGHYYSDDDDSCPETEERPNYDVGPSKS